MLHPSDNYFGLSPSEGCKLAFKFATALQKKMPETWTKNQMAGIEWFRGFMKRHPKLSLQKPETTNSNRAFTRNSHNVSLPFDLNDDTLTPNIDHQR